jgi:hypothetical protein
MARKPTQKMWDALEAQLSKRDVEDSIGVFPKQFLLALRLALESGMSCQQITSAIMIHSSLADLSDKLDGDSLLDRVGTVMEVIKNDRETRKWSQQSRQDGLRKRLMSLED